MAVTAAASCVLCADKLVAPKFNLLRGSFLGRQVFFKIRGLSSTRALSRNGRNPSRAVLVETPPTRVLEKAGGQTKDRGQRPMELVLSDDSLKSTLEHRFWVSAGAVALVAMITKGVMAAHSFEDIVAICSGAFASYLLSDLGTGFYHWGVDNYGDAKTPLVGSQIDAFQGHHKRPWTITKREFANNIHAIARPATIFLTPFFALPGNPGVDTFLGLFLGFVVMSQQFHAWSHMKKSQLPSAVVALQESGLLIPRKMHGAHHRAPYDINYCIVSGWWNPLLDSNRIFPSLEAFIHSNFGVAPRSWGETNTEWLQEGSYFEDGEDFSSGQQ